MTKLVGSILLVPREPAGIRHWSINVHNKSKLTKNYLHKVKAMCYKYDLTTAKPNSRISVLDDDSESESTSTIDVHDMV